MIPRHSQAKRQSLKWRHKDLHLDAHTNHLKKVMQGKKNDSQIYEIRPISQDYDATVNLSIGRSGIMEDTFVDPTGPA